MESNGMNCVKKVKILDTYLGYASEDREKALLVLNEHLKDNWKLLDIIKDQKYSLNFKGFVTHSYFVIGC